MKSLRSRSAYWIKLVLIGILLIVVQLITYMVVLQRYQISLESEYQKSLDFNFSNYNEYISYELNTVYDNFDQYYNDENFAASYRGYVGENRTLALVYDGKLQHYTLNQSDYNNLKNQRLNFNTLRYLSGANIASDEKMAILSKTDDSGICKILIFTKDQFLKRNAEYGYKDFFIIDRNRKEVLGAYANVDVFQSVILSSDLTAVQRNLFESVDGVDGIVTLSSFQFEEGLWLVGFVDIVTVTSAVRAVAFEVGSVMCLTLLLCVAFTIAAAIIYTKKQDFIYGYNINTKDFYVVYTDNLGNIKRANAEFKHRYNVQNLFEAQSIDPNFHQLATNDNYIIQLANREKQIEILNFLSTKTAKGFKLVGVEGSDLSEYYLKQLETPYLDPATSLFNGKRLKEDYAAFKGNGRRVLGAVKLSNIALFGSLFGRKFYGQILKTYAQRMRERFSDLGKVYSISADTFAIYLEDEDNIQAFLRDAESEINHLNLAANIGENIVKIACKAGFVIVDKMIDNDYEYVTQCYKATLKRALDGDADYYVYHESQKTFYEKYFEKDIDLDDLLATNALSLYYQPQLSLKTGKICGFEALLRVKKSYNLNISVFDLVCHAEQTGQMVKLGNFIFNEGMKFAAQLNDPSIDISLNVSPVQLMQAGFAEDFIKLFRSYQLKKNAIYLEVTESYMMTDVETSILKFELLKKEGIEICLDDFGMGYSSLQYLKKLPVSVIKIDREFIKDIVTNEYSQMITKLIIKLCKDLNLRCNAEGVEDETQIELLRNYGCDMAQGYYISKAVSQDNVRALIYKYNHKGQTANGTVIETNSTNIVTETLLTDVSAHSAVNAPLKDIAQHALAEVEKEVTNSLNSTQTDSLNNGLQTAQNVKEVEKEEINSLNSTQSDSLNNGLQTAQNVKEVEKEEINSLNSTQTDSLNSGLQTAQNVKEVEKEEINSLNSTQTDSLNNELQTAKNSRKEIDKNVIATSANKLAASGKAKSATAKNSKKDLKNKLNTINNVKTTTQKLPKSSQQNDKNPNTQPLDQVNPVGGAEGEKNE